MKAFSIWLAMALGTYGAAAAGYHTYLSDNPQRVLVVVDSSHAMRDVWPQVDGVLDRIASRPYAEFSLYTEKSRVHGWASRFRPGRMSPYAPRDLAQLEELRGTAEFAEADEIVLVTNAPESEIRAFDSWSVLRPGR